MDSRKNLPFLLLTFSVLIVLILPLLIQDGMFMDGTQYACVAKNMAHGKGTFWFPYLSKTWWIAESNNFLEQPPLVYWLQSLFFRLFGDNMYVERFYSLLTAIITAWIIILSWKTIPFEDKRIRNLSWLPVLFWIIIPTCFWPYSNNILENTMGIFSALSVFFIFKAMQQKGMSYLLFICAGISIFLASLSKGLPGLFPLTSILLYYLLFHDNISFSKALSRSIFLFSIPFLIYLLLMAYPPAHNSLLFYFKERLLFRVNNNPTVTSRFFIIRGLIEDILPPAILCILLIILLKRKYPYLKYSRNLLKHAYFFFLLGASASLPLLLTPVQKKFYLLPAFPFFGIAFALLAAPYVNEFLSLNLKSVKSMRRLTITAILVLLASVSFSFMQIGKTCRDKDMLHDVYIIGSSVPKDSILTLNESMKEQWALQFYLLRYFNISSSLPDHPHYYYLAEKASVTDSTSADKIRTEMKLYELYRQK